MFGKLFRRALTLALATVVIAVAWVVFHRGTDFNGTVLMALRQHQGETVRHDWVSIDAISPHLIRAVIAAEDMKFCRHVGFDFGELKAAIEDARNGGRLRGASTISQQTAKNAFLWPGRGPVRKLAEVPFTMTIETAWPKERIMEVYLNVAEWGNGYFGAEAAAQGRFGKSAAELTQYEAALLASVLPNPHEWRVDPPGPYVQQRSQKLIRRMNIVSRKGLDGCVFQS